MILFQALPGSGNLSRYGSDLQETVPVIGQFNDLLPECVFLFAAQQEAAGAVALAQGNPAAPQPCLPR